MNRIVDGRFAKPPPNYEPNREQKRLTDLAAHIDRKASPKPPCDHYSIRRDGQIVCQKCEAVWNLGINGPIWVEHGA